MSSPTLPGNTEHDDQVRIFAWAAQVRCAYPELELMFAIPNGAKLPWKKDSQGRRFSPEAFRLKQEGLKPGVPDICLPVPIGKYHGFYLELKHGDNKPSQEQVCFIDALKARGYFVVVTWGWEAAIVWIMDYLEGRL